MTLAELAAYDGRDGRRAYVAVNDKIYDVTDSPLWQGGLHPPDHQAGRDLTEELTKAPHVRSIVERFPVRGTLTEGPQAATTSNNGKIVTGIIIAAVIIALVLFLLL